MRGAAGSDPSVLQTASESAYIGGVRAFVRTMEINARVISGLDPGAIPGGSTNPLLPALSAGGLHGADQHRQTCKGDCLLPAWLTVSGHLITANDNFAEE